MALGWQNIRAKHGLKLGEQNQVYPYKEGRLVDATGDIAKKWYVIYYAWNIDTETLDRKRIFITGRTDADRRRAAATVIKQVNADLKAGAFISAKAPKPKQEVPPEAKRLNEDMLLTDAAAYFIEQKTAALSDTTMKGYRGMMKRFLKFCQERRWHKIAVKRFDKEMAYEFFDSLALNPDIENKTYNNYIGLVGGLFTFFHKREVIKRNPCDSIEQLPVNSGGHVPFTTVQARALKELMLQKEDQQLWLFCAMMYYTFSRPGKELRFLKVKNIMADHIHIDRSHSKSGKAKNVIIPDGLEQLLQQLKIRDYPREHYVFSIDGKPGAKHVGAVYFYRHHRKLLVELEMTEREYDMYSWKHTGNIAAYLAGADLMYLRDQNGHHSVSQTEKYLKDLGLIRLKGDDHHPVI